MARTREFDRDVALDSAMRLFWRKGYEGTSTSELLAELGIARASLYGTFGSKRELYIRALERFLDGSAAPNAAEILVSDESAVAALRALLYAYISLPDASTPTGCFSVNATVEHGDTDEAISSRLERSRVRLESALYGALLRAHAQGELAANVDPKGAATMLLALINGLKVLSRAGQAQNERMQVAIESTLSLLAAPMLKP